MKKFQRPLSPHLQIYRLPKTALASITHRVTGVFLCFGLLLMSAVMGSLASGPACFESLQSLAGSWPGRLMAFAWTVCFMFHLCHGTRHLLWDAGVGFDRDSMDRNTYLVLIIAISLSLVVWVVAYSTTRG